MTRKVVARLRAGWSPSGPSYDEFIARTLRFGGSFIGMSGEADRSGLKTMWADYVYFDVQSARWDAARVAAAAAINDWPSVWVEWAKEGDPYRAPTPREVERVLKQMLNER